MTPRLEHALRGLLVAAAIMPAAAFAHAGHGDVASFSTGIYHPLTGMDHMIAAFAVGLWATSYRLSRPWLPVLFVFAMLTGAVLAFRGVHLPAVEPTIVASVLLLGALMAVSRHVALGLAMIVVIVIGLFHGFAHGSEAGSRGDHNTYLAGLAVATLLLHLAGMGVGAMLRVISKNGVRIGGALVAAAGLWFAYAALA